MASSPMAADIFLSYARKDLKRAVTYAEAFKKAGWTVFWDRGILPGSAFTDVIERELKGCQCVIVLWSAACSKSTWVRNEAAVGSERRVLLPVLIDDVSLPVEFRHWQAANLRHWKGDVADKAFAQLLDAIANLVPRSRDSKLTQR